MVIKIILLVLLSIFIYSKDCNVSNITTKENIIKEETSFNESVLEIKKAILSYENHKLKMNSLLEELKNSYYDCTRWDILYEKINKEEYTLEAVSCRKLHKKRLIDFLKITRAFSMNHKKINEDMKILKLKMEMIKNTSLLLN